MLWALVLYLTQSWLIFRSAFGTTSTSSNPSTQRIIAEEIVEEIDEINDEPPTKTLKLDNPQTKSTIKKNESWNKSIGALRKPALNSLVKAKRPDAGSLVKLKSTVVTEKTSDKINLSTDDKKSVPSVTSCTATVSSVVSEEAGSSKPAASGLSLLAGYPGSDSDGSDD